MSLYRTMALIAAGAVLAGCAATAPHQPGATGTGAPDMAGTAPETGEGTLYIGIGIAQAGEDDSRSKSRTDAERLAWLDAAKKAFGVRVEEYLETKDGILIESTSNLTAGGNLIYRGREKKDSFDGTTYTVWLRAEVKRRVPAEAPRLSEGAPPEDGSRPPETEAAPSVASSGSAAGNASAPASRAGEASGAGPASGAAAPPTVSQAEKECAADDKAFERAKKSGSWIDYSLYQVSHPKSRHMEEAGILGDLAYKGKRLGEEFQDCPECPTMVVVPAGCFMMGSKKSEDGDDDERTRLQVTIENPFAVGVYEVTRSEWQQCHREKACDVDATKYIHRYDDTGRRVQYGAYKNYPMINVNMDDVLQYVRWLQKKSKGYRLLSEAEWEYVARAGTTSLFWWGDGVGVGRANCDGCIGGMDGKGPTLVGKFSEWKNDFGLYDVHGNVWEWVQDCWNENYHRSQEDGSPRTSSGDGVKCSDGVVRGGSWYREPEYLRSANRSAASLDTRYRDIGFRVARTLTPP